MAVGAQGGGDLQIFRKGAVRTVEHHAVKTGIYAPQQKLLIGAVIQMTVYIDRVGVVERLYELYKGLFTHEAGAAHARHEDQRLPEPRRRFAQRDHFVVGVDVKGAQGIVFVLCTQ